MVQGKKLSWRRILEAILVWVIALGLTQLLLGLESEPIGGYLDLILAGLWLYLPVPFIWARKEGLKDFALSRLNLSPALKWFVLSSLLILPPFYLIGYLGALKLLHLRFQLFLPKNFFSLCLSQLFLISLPEEWFFRGYLQGRFNQVFERRWRFLGGEIGAGLFLSAFFFSLSHFIIRQSLESFLVFFPGLVFGWLREKTDSLLAPVLFHFLANLTFIIFQLSFIS